MINFFEFHIQIVPWNPRAWWSRCQEARCLRGGGWRWESRSEIGLSTAAEGHTIAAEGGTPPRISGNWDRDFYVTKILLLCKTRLTGNGSCLCNLTVVKIARGLMLGLSYQELSDRKTNFSKTNHKSELGPFRWGLLINYSTILNAKRPSESRPSKLVGKRKREKINGQNSDPLLLGISKS